MHNITHEQSIVTQNPPLTLQDIVEHFKKPKKTPAGYNVICPCHDDSTPSLSITEKGGKFLLHCHAGCKTEDIVASINLEMRDLFTDARAGTSKPKRVVAEYYYRDASGKVLYRKIRTDPKGFFQQRLVNGEWINGLADVQRVLYRLPELLTAHPDATVFITAGEKDAERCRSLGLVATTNSEAEGQGKWKDEYSRALSGRECVVLQDNDRTGEEHVVSVARSLKAHAKSIKVLLLPNLPKGGDVSDWLDAGGDAGQLCMLAEECPEWVETEISPDSGASEFPEFGGLYSSLNELFDADLPVPESIIFGIPRGQVGMLNAITNKGKTTFLENVCLQLVTGRPWPPLVPADSPLRRIVYIDWESTPSEQQADLALMCRNIPHDARERFIPIIGPTLNEESLNLSKSLHMAYLVALLGTLKPDLVVIDTVTAAFELFNENDNAEIARKISRPLRHLARVANCAVIASHHQGKPTTNEGETREEAYSGRGGSQFGGFARAVYNIREDKTRGEGYIIFSSGKIKRKKFEPVLFKLNFDTRWFEYVETSEPVIRPGVPTVDEVVAFIKGRGGATTKMIVEAFEDRGNERSIKTRIYDAEKIKKIHKPNQKAPWHARSVHCATNECVAQTTVAHCTNEGGEDE